MSSANWSAACELSYDPAGGDTAGGIAVEHDNDAWGGGDELILCRRQPGAEQSDGGQPNLM